MKIIAVMPVKNEAWILPKTLPALSKFCDAIIIADQNSTDQTPQILHSFGKVHIIGNEEVFHSNLVRWKLLEAAREFDGHNLILALDADELLASAVLKQESLELLASTPIGGSVELQWIQLWRSPYQYRDDSSAWSNSWKQFAFRDDRQMMYEQRLVINDHTSRIPGAALSKNTRLVGIPVLHFQFTVFERMLAKQRWYRVTEYVASMRSPTEINATYIIVRDERDIRLKDTPTQWTQGWKDLGIDLENFQAEDLFWYDIEILHFFSKYGTKYFADLDIWDVDWERKRQLALSQGIDGLPGEPVRDPRNLEQKLYHAYLNHYISTPLWRRGADVVGLSWRMAQRLGVQRAHLEHLGIVKPHAQAPSDAGEKFGGAP